MWRRRRVITSHGVMKAHWSRARKGLIPKQLSWCLFIPRTENYSGKEMDKTNYQVHTLFKNSPPIEPFRADSRALLPTSLCRLSR
jgi:hypothetical protein